MARCAGAKPDGTPCERIVSASSEYCYAHDPTTAEARRRNASKGGKGNGRGRAAFEVRDIKRQVRELVGDVRAGRLNKGDAAVIGQLLNVALRALSVERAWHEADDLEARLDALETEDRAERLAESGDHWR